MASGNILASGGMLSERVQKRGYQPSASIQRYPGGQHYVAVFPKITSAPNPAVDIIFNATHLYAGGGITVGLLWTADVIVGNVLWGASIERLVAGGAELTTESFAAERTTATATPGTALQWAAITTIAFTSGAQMDSLAASEFGRCRVRRVADNASDTAAVSSKAYLAGWYIKET